MCKVFKELSGSFSGSFFKHFLVEGTCYPLRFVLLLNSAMRQSLLELPCKVRLPVAAAPVHAVVAVSGVVPHDRDHCAFAVNWRKLYGPTVKQFGIVNGFFNLFNLHDVSLFALCFARCALCLHCYYKQVAKFLKNFPEKVLKKLFAKKGLHCNPLCALLTRLLRKCSA